MAMLVAVPFFVRVWCVMQMFSLSSFPFFLLNIGVDLAVCFFFFTLQAVFEERVFSEGFFSRKVTQTLRHKY